MAIDPLVLPLDYHTVTPTDTRTLEVKQTSTTEQFNLVSKCYYRQIRHDNLGEIEQYPGLELIKMSCSTQLSMKLILNAH